LRRVLEGAFCREERGERREERGERREERGERREESGERREEQARNEGSSLFSPLSFLI
jgi:hypothetical protein